LRVVHGGDHTEPPLSPSAPSRADLLEVETVSVSFDGVKALDGVSLHVARGSIVGLIGPNGAGKTTLFNVISGLQRPDSGSVRLEGVDITSLAPYRRAALGIGRSFQNLGLMLGETVRTNLLGAQFLSAGYHGWEVLLRPWRWRTEEQRLETRAVQAAEAFGVGPLIDRRVDDLSFGQSRFAELACVLAQQPRLMLLDEPTTGLDLRATKRLRQRLVELRDQGETILLVAHNVSFVLGLCDWVYVLAAGKLLAEGSSQAIRSHPEVASVYLGAGHGR